MKAVILAGGYGTRLSEETHLKPKPMINIGGRPILWHIMKLYSSHGITEFIICCGYKGYVIKEYFSNYQLHNSDVTYDFSNGKIEIHNKMYEDWKVTLIDTGLNTMTGGRLLRAKDFIGKSTFCFTYGDGLSNVDIRQLINHHKESEAIATVTAVQAPGRYGALSIDDFNKVKGFREKPKGDGSWINGGFFVCEEAVFDFIEDDDSSWELSPLEKIASSSKLSAYYHKGFWQPMDTLRDKKLLENLWSNGNPPWKNW